MIITKNPTGFSGGSVKINEVKENSKIRDIIGTISLMNGIEEMEHFRVQNGIIQDETGQIKIKFWQDQAGKFKVGDKIKVTSGFCKTFQDEKFITSGKFGKIIKVIENG